MRKVLKGAQSTLQYLIAIVVEIDSQVHSGPCVEIMSDVLAGVTLQSIPQDRLIHFGSVTAYGSALARLEVQEVMLLSADWQTSGFSIPVCGAPIQSSVAIDIQGVSQH